MMGKLHKIRRAFGQLSVERKRDILFHKHGCRFDADGKVEFTEYWKDKPSYQNFVAKLAGEWIVKYFASRQNTGVALRD